MNNWERATGGMDVKNWPHRFTKNGNVVQVGEAIDGSGRKYDPLFAQPMICVDCHKEFISGKQARPPDPCPARTMQREKKRLMS